jgi:hypothetical protein
LAGKGERLGDKKAKRRKIANEKASKYLFGAGQQMVTGGLRRRYWRRPGSPRRHWSTWPAPGHLYRKEAICKLLQPVEPPQGWHASF